MKTKNYLISINFSLLNENNKQWEKYKDKVSISETEINRKIDLRNKARANKDYQNR